MSGSRIFLIVLVALAVLLALAMGLGATQDGNRQVDLNLSWVQRIQTTLARDLALSEMAVAPGSAGGCAVAEAQITVPVGGVCHLTVQAAPWSTLVRALEMDVTLGLAVQVNLPGNDRFPQNVRYTPSRPVRLSFTRAGGALDIACLNAGVGTACVLVVRE